jgi:ABC-type amino acid transport substrate-binding protein
MAGSVHYRNLSDNTIISIIMSKYHKYEGCVLMNKNKKLHMSVFVFLSIFSLFVYTPLHSAASETDAIVVGVPVDRCPVIYEDNGKITGIGVDLITEAAKMADIKITVKPLVGETLKDALDNDNYDIVMPFGSAIESTSGKKVF